MFFAFGQNTQTGKVQESPGGTGFFVARSSNLPRLHHIYGISNAHVVQNNHLIRINTKGGGTRLFEEIIPADWVSSEHEDLAAVDVTDYFEREDNDQWVDSFFWIHEQTFLTSDFVWSDHIGIGDETIMLGLFVDHSGGATKNVPVGRFGTLAAMADPSTPVTLYKDDRYVRPAYLNDMRSRDGFSGSPVWVWGATHTDMSTWEGPGLYRESLAHRSRAFLYLMGTHRGQFRETTMIDKRETTGPLRGGDKIEIASAMTVVIPATEISELLDRPRLKDQRDARDKREDRLELSNRLCGLAKREETRD